jgi:hypothetical protein
MIQLIPVHIRKIYFFKDFNIVFSSLIFNVASLPRSTKKGLGGIFPTVVVCPT